MPSEMKHYELMDLSVKEAGEFCQKMGLPNLHLVRDILVFSQRAELLQIEYWKLEVMLAGSIAKELECPRPNGFTELVDNIKWHIGDLRAKNEWLIPLDAPY